MTKYNKVRIFYHLHSHQINFIAFLMFFAMQILLWQYIEKQKPDIEIVPPAPNKIFTKFASFGDEELLFRILGARLQNSGDVFAGFVALKNYDYNRVYDWLVLLDDLNSESNFTPSLASYYYSQTQNRQDNYKIVKYLNDHSIKNLNKKWWWIVQSVNIASFIPDQALAIKSAEIIANNNFDNAPLWTRTIATMLKGREQGLDANCLSFKVISNLLSDNESKAREINAEEMNFMRNFIKSKLEEFRIKKFNPNKC